MKKEWLHFIGIKGVGMSALALVAHGMGYKVTGSDSADSYGDTGAALEKADVEMWAFDAERITHDMQRVIIGTSFGDDNPEVKAAKQKNIKTQTYSEFLSELANAKKLLAVAGTHGKTTTTSLLAYLLRQAGLDPSWIIGTSHISGLPAHGGAGKGEFFVVEADEYKKAANDPTPKFLDFKPYVAIINNIEYDHPDMYPSFESFIDAFRLLIRKVRDDGFLVVNGDDPVIQKLMKEFPSKKFVTYGLNEDNEYRIEPDENGFCLAHTEKGLGLFCLRLPGKHNLYNAAAAVTVALSLGVDLMDLQGSIPAFKNVERRYQETGKVGDILVIDDYAHHPTAVATTLETAKKQFPNQPLWCIFQPHTYSRTEALKEEFGRAFAAADTVVITDIFGSSRESTGTITAQDLVAEIAKHHKNVHYCAKDELLDYLKRELPNNAVVFTMGAGDIYKVGQQFVKEA